VLETLHRQRQQVYCGIASLRKLCFPYCFQTLKSPQIAFKFCFQTTVQPTIPTNYRLKRVQHFNTCTVFSKWSGNISACGPHRKKQPTAESHEHDYKQLCVISRNLYQTVPTQHELDSVTLSKLLPKCPNPLLYDAMAFWNKHYLISNWSFPYTEGVWGQVTKDYMHLTKRWQQEDKESTYWTAL
jgi:hypothetical protein